MLQVDDPALAHALRWLADERPPVIAGGTDFYPALGDAPPPPAALDLSGLPSLRGIRHEADATWIGAASTWQDVIREPLPPAFAALQAASREVGSVQIQSRATLGGNLCTASPAADGVPPLLALEANVVLASGTGIRELALSDFLLGPRRTARRDDELLIGLRVPHGGKNAVSRFAKLGARRYLVISIAMLAMLLEADERGRASVVRIAVGACSPVAVRLPLLEAALLEVELGDTRSLDEAIGLSLARGALDALQPIDDVRASASYRRDALATLIARLVRDTAADALDAMAGGTH